MNFFASVFAPPEEDDDGGDDPQDEETYPEPDGGDSDEKELPSGSGSGGWSFGGFVRNFAATAVRDLEDLGSGLRRETAAIREVAAAAARGLPGALDAGVSVAQESLESVGQAVDTVGDTVFTLLSSGRDALLTAAEDDADQEAVAASAAAAPPVLAPVVPRYTRYEAQLMALRADPSTFAEPPEDVEGFERWHKGFQIGEAEKADIEVLLKENAGLQGLIEGLVPQVVDYETFWSRYFFRLDRLRQAEHVRTKLVNLAKGNADNEEELSWEVDEDEVENQDSSTVIGKNEREAVQDDSETVEEHKEAIELLNVQEAVAAEAALKDGNGDSNSDESGSKYSDVVGQEGKAGSSKDSEFSVVSRPAASEEEDLGWEEIEELAEQPDKKPIDTNPKPSDKLHTGPPRRPTEDDEDLSWDVDDGA